MLTANSCEHITFGFIFFSGQSSLKVLNFITKYMDSHYSNRSSDCKKNLIPYCCKRITKCTVRKHNYRLIYT